MISSFQKILKIKAYVYLHKPYLLSQALENQISPLPIIVLMMSYIDCIGRYLSFLRFEIDILLF